MVYVPFLGSPKGDLEAMLPNLARKTVERNISLLSYDPKGGSPGLSLKGDLGPDFELINQTIDSQKNDSGKPVLVVMAQDALEAVYGTDLITRDLARSISVNKSTGNVRLQISSPNTALLSALRALSDSEIRIETLHGTSVLSSAKPGSVHNGLIRDPSARGKMGLIPIV